METQWIEHIDSLAERVHENDLSLIHLQPYPVEEATEESDQIWSASSLFHMMILLDDEAVQRALQRLWTAVRETGNTNITQVSIPAAWPAADLRRAFASLGYLEKLEELNIVSGNTRNSDNDRSHSALRGWHVSSLELARDVLPFFDAMMLLADQSEQPRIGSSRLKHVRIDCRVLIGSQDEVNQLGRSLAPLSRLENLSLHLVAQRLGLGLTLEPVMQTLVQLSHITETREVPGLRSLSIHWRGDPINATKHAALSVSVLERLLNQKSNDRETSLRSVHLHGMLFEEEHFIAVSRALVSNTTLEELQLYGHKLNYKTGGETTVHSVNAIRNALEDENYSLKQLSLFTESEVQAQASINDATSERIRWSLRHSLLTSDVADYDAEAEYAEKNERDCRQACHLLQQQMDIYCRLNSLGRGSLTASGATAKDWVDVMARCSHGGSKTARSNSALRHHLEGPILDTGLNEIFTLLRSHPSLCNESKRSTTTKVPHELASQELSYQASSFKDFTAPSTTITKALAIDWRKKRSARNRRPNP